MLPTRPLQIADFLEQHGWAAAEVTPFAGDFSPRRYARLTQDENRTAILMDADADQKTPQFVALARLLRERGLPTPEIYATASDQGLVLMQDFGAHNVGALIDAGADPLPLLRGAVEILAQLHRQFNRTESLELGLPLFNTALFIKQAELFLDAYIPFAQQREVSENERADFRAAWRATLRPLDTLPKSLLLRDFMPDNLMLLTESNLGIERAAERIPPPLAGRVREGGHPQTPSPDFSLGILDFQDAGIGCIAYDIASLCETVRRDGLFDLLPALVARYRDISQTPVSQADLVRACTILSAQRHTRILGLVANLALKQGRRDKLTFLPRIQTHLNNILSAPYLLPIRDYMHQIESTSHV